MAGVMVKIDSAGIKRRFEGKFKKALLILKGQIAADTAPFVPRVTGDLEHSVKPSDMSPEPFLKWTSVYARRQYYGQFKHSFQAHSRACRLWYEAAKAENRERWIRVTDRTIKG